jgi:hypothetical protein
MINKKTIPLVILKAFESFVDLKGELFLVTQPENSLLKIIDNDKDSNFYFNAAQYEKQQGGAYKLLIDYKPVSHIDPANSTVWIDVKDLQSYFKIWIGLLEEYAEVKSFFDDPILKSFTEEYYAEFEILDDDNAHINPLSIKQIMLIDQHLEFIEENLEKYETESNREQLQEIKNDIIILRNNLTNQSKAWVIKHLSKTWGKLTKQGTKFLKDFLTEAKKQVIVEGVKFLLNHGTDLLPK